MCIYDTTISIDDETRKYSFGRHNGNILLPKLEGKYPLLVLLHGMGRSHEWQDNKIISNLNEWIIEDELMPMVVIMPTLPPKSNGKYDSDSYYNYIRMDAQNNFKELMDYICSNFSSYIIDEVKYHAVAGASMGGAGALFAGILYKEYFMHVGGFSPSQQLYISDDDGWIKKRKDLIFNRDSSATHFLGYSTKEPYDFEVYVKQYHEAFKQNGFVFSEGIVHDKGHCYASFNNQLRLFLKQAFGKER